MQSCAKQTWIAFKVWKISKVFENLLSFYEDPFAKLTLIEGDMQVVGLGISSENREKIISEVELVFHAAADVRFDESLREVTEINVRGTREVMLLSQQIQNLNVLVYVSTAFCTPGFYVKEKCEIYFRPVAVRFNFPRKLHKIFKITDFVKSRDPTSQLQSELQFPF